jgi:hypothetical protein
MGKKQKTFDKDFNMSCERNSVLSDQGAEYEPAWVTVATNKQPYTVTMPSDIVYNSHLASRASERISDLEDKLVEAQSKFDIADTAQKKLSRQIAGMKVVNKRATVGAANPGGEYTVDRSGSDYEFFKCYTPASYIRDRLCRGADQKYITRSHVRGGDSCGYITYVVTCVTFGK